MDPAAMYCTSSEHYGKGSLPSWVNDKKCAKPMSPEASFATWFSCATVGLKDSVRGEGEKGKTYIHIHVRILNLDILETTRIHLAPTSC